MLSEMVIQGNSGRDLDNAGLSLMLQRKNAKGSFSTSIEGQRHARKKFATTLVHVYFYIASSCNTHFVFIYNLLNKIHFTSGCLSKCFFTTYYLCLELCMYKRKYLLKFLYIKIVHNFCYMCLDLPNILNIVFSVPLVHQYVTSWNKYCRYDRHVNCRK